MKNSTSPFLLCPFEALCVDGSLSKGRMGKLILFTVAMMSCGSALAMKNKKNCESGLVKLTFYPSSGYSHSVSGTIGSIESFRKNISNRLKREDKGQFKLVLEEKKESGCFLRTFYGYTWDIDYKRPNNTKNKWSALTSTSKEFNCPIGQKEKVCMKGEWPKLFAYFFDVETGSGNWDEIPIAKKNIIEDICSSLDKGKFRNINVFEKEGSSDRLVFLDPPKSPRWIWPSGFEARVRMMGSEENKKRIPIAVAESNVRVNLGTKAASICCEFENRLDSLM